MRSLLLIMLLSSCAFERQVQLSETTLRLIRIENPYRYGVEKQLLVYRDIQTGKEYYEYRSTADSSRKVGEVKNLLVKQ